MDSKTLLSNIDVSTGARNVVFYNYTVEKLKEAALIEMACVSVEIIDDSNDDKLKILCQRLKKNFDDSIYRTNENGFVIFTLMNITKTNLKMNQIKDEMDILGIKIAFGAVPQTDALNVDKMIELAINKMNESKISKL